MLTSHTIVSVCTANLPRTESLGVFWRNYINGRNDNTRKLLIEAANSFESVRSETESFNYIHRVTTLTSTTVGSA